MKNIKIKIMIILLFGAYASAGAVMELNSRNFQRIISSKKPVLVKFWASWCGPCRKMTPEFKKASMGFVGKVIFAELNIDKNRAVASKYGVNGVPTTILFKNGKELGREPGFYRSADIAKWANWSLK